MPLAAAELSFSVSALLAFQRVAGISMLPVHLRIRPQLLRISDTDLTISDEEEETLTRAGLLTASGPEPDALMMVRALAFPDAEINLTLAAAGRSDTYVCVARRHELLVVAARCGDDVTIDAYTGVGEPELVGMLADTIRAYLFDGDDTGVGGPLERVTFPLDPIHETLCAEEPQRWVTVLHERGIPRQLASLLYRCEVDLQGRAEVAAYLNHEGARSEPDTIVRLTTIPDGAILTSFASDNNDRRWLTVEPYESPRLERIILSAIRSVPQAAWFTHNRTD